VRISWQPEKTTSDVSGFLKAHQHN